MKSKVKIAIPVCIVLVLIGVGINVSMGENDKVVNPIPAPKLPDGFSDVQVQQAKALSEKEQTNESNIPSIPEQNIKPLIAYQGGSNQLYALVCCVDDRYTVYSYGIYPSYLQIPIKTEIWRSTDFQPPAVGYASYSLYYWNYYSNSWQYINTVGGFTYAGTGQVNLGFSIPNRLSDKFYIDGRDYLWNGYAWDLQGYYKFITVNWLT